MRPSEHRPLLFGDLAEVETLAIRHEGQELTAADRKALLERVRAGEAITIEFDARTFIQRETPNRKFFRFKPGALARLARSFRRAPFLRDHDDQRLEARGGTVLKSELVKSDSEAAIFQTIQATKPWAVEGVLDGTIDRFSIGFIFSERPTCSVHGTPVFQGCSCSRGDTVDGRRVEFVVGEAEGIEVSSVNVPAVVGTGIDEVRAALAALDHRGGEPHPQEWKMKRVITTLGLSEAANEDQILAAIGTLQDDHRRQTAELEATRERLKAAETTLAESNRQLAEERDRLTADRVDQRITEMKRKGALPAKEGRAETWLRQRAKEGGLEVFEQLAADFPPGVYHLGDQPRQLDAERPPPKEPASVLETDTFKRAMAATGVTPEMVARYNGLSILGGGKAV